MAVNLQQVINDAIKLSSRLKDDETKSDALITQAKCTQNQLEHIKQFTDDVEILNEAASQRSQSVLVAGLQRESQHIRDLQAENKELRGALEDYKNAIELIMSKYRQQMAKLTSNTHSDVSIPNFYNSKYCQINLEQFNQIKEMREIMRRAVTMDEEEALRDRETITQLMIENKGLRELVQIHKEYGRPNLPPVDKRESPAAEPTVNPSADSKLNEEETPRIHS